MSNLTKTYLILYNGTECALWSYLTCTTLFVATSRPTTYNLPLLEVTQSLALLEIFHALLGLVRSSPATTALQIGGKNLVVWLVMSGFSDLIESTTLGTAAYTGCLMAWGLSETIRYAFFFMQLRRGVAPSWLAWLRYNAFLLLYPVGLLSEATLVWLVLQQGSGSTPAFRAFLSTGLLLYIPAGPYLYSHMLAQRRKTLSQLSR